MCEHLKEAIKNRTAVLFVGAGVSATLGIPTWQGLLDIMGKALGYDSEIFKSLDSNWLAQAEYFKIQNDERKSLIDWMKNNWNVNEDKLLKSEIHRLIAELNFSTIYTTNYDKNIETALSAHSKPYKTIVNFGDDIIQDTAATTVVKLHGDLDCEGSIVLTESSYFERMDFSHPLDMRLQLDGLSRPILFIGYSLKDINIRFMLYRLAKIWKEKSSEGLVRPKSYLFLTRPNPVEECVLREWNIETLVGQHDDEAKSLAVFLRSLKH